MYCDSPDWVLDILGKRTLLECILDVHMTTTGTLERSEPSQQRDDIKALKHRLDNWTPSSPRSASKFDNAVYNLLSATIEEANSDVAIEDLADDPDVITAEQARKGADLALMDILTYQKRTIYEEIKKSYQAGKKYLQYNISGSRTGIDPSSLTPIIEELRGRGYSVQTNEYMEYLRIKWH